MHSHGDKRQDKEALASYVALNPPKYSFLKDSVLAKYAGNTAMLFGVCDAIINCLTAQLKAIENNVFENIPYYVKGLYYLLPPILPLATYIKHRKENYQENFDPDAIELLDVLKKNDNALAELLVKDPEEEAKILELLTSYLRYEKNQPFGLIVNLIFLSIRTAQGLLAFIEGFELASKETQDNLKNWTALISSLVNITYMAILLFHNNFQKFNLSAHKVEHVKSHLLQATLFRVKQKLGSGKDETPALSHDKLAANV